MNKKKELFYPWGKDNEFSGGLDLLHLIKADLAKKFPPNAFTKSLPRGVQKCCEALCQSVLSRVGSDTSYPWVVALSPSSEVLQAFAKTVPIILSLTRFWRPIVASPDEVLSAVRYPRPRNDFEDDPSGEFIHQVKRCGVLVWEDFLEPLKGIKDFTAVYVKILSARVRREHPTILLGRSLGKDNIQVTTIDRVRIGYGESISDMVKELALIKKF